VERAGRIIGRHQGRENVRADDQKLDVTHYALTYSQAARHLGVGEHEIRQRVERSEMRHIKGGPAAGEGGCHG